MDDTETNMSIKRVAWHGTAGFNSPRLCGEYRSYQRRARHLTYNQVTTLKPNNN